MDDKNNKEPERNLSMVFSSDFSHIASDAQAERRRQQDERIDLLVDLMKDFSAELKETNKRLEKIETYFLIGRVTVAVATAIFAAALWMFDWFTEGAVTLKSMIKDWLDIK